MKPNPEPISLQQRYSSIHFSSRPTKTSINNPRTFQNDVAGCEAHGVDVVFAPDNDAMYPAGFQTQVRVREITQVLEGVHRPSHFDGVTTVVSKLFNLTGRCVAIVGRKDYQQWKMLETMARDLDMPVEVVGCPIVREDDGLAMSSRNRYLSPEGRGPGARHCGGGYGQRIKPSTTANVALKNSKALRA